MNTSRCIQNRYSDTPFMAGHKATYGGLLC